MSEYTFNNWVNGTSSSYYLGFDDNAVKRTTTQFSLSDDVYTAGTKIVWFSEVPAEDLVAPRNFRFGSSYFIYVTTSIPAGTFVGYDGDDRWVEHTWTADDPDGATFGNQNTQFNVPNSTRLTPTLPEGLTVNFIDPALSRLTGSYFEDNSTFVYGETAESRKQRMHLLGYL